MRSLRLFCLLLATCFCLLFSASTSKAASVTIYYIDIVFSDCSTFMDFTMWAYYSATTDDNNGMDAWGYILSDSNGREFAVGETLGYVGQSFTGGLDFVVWNWTPGYIPTVPLTLSVYDTPFLPIPSISIANIRVSPLIDTFTFDPTDYGICFNFSSSSGGEAAPFNDGRLNNWDMGNPVVVYGHDFETGRGLVVYSTTGELLLIATDETIAAVPECPEVNSLIASSNNVNLYRLTDCSYQINAPSLDGTKTYVMIFYALYPDTGYISHEE